MTPHADLSGLVALVRTVAENGTSSLTLVNSVVGLLGFALAVVSLTWQTVAWRLSGGRARAELQIGAIDKAGRAYVTLPAQTSVGAIEMLASEGFSRKALFVTVRNTGRLPVSVERCVVRLPKDYKVEGLAFAVGPGLPCQLDIGKSETWGIELSGIEPMVQVLREGLDFRSVKVRVEISLGNSKAITTRQTAIL